MALEGQTRCYVDTSALIKRYVAESGSAEFDVFCTHSADELVISPLVSTEFESSLQRRLRMGQIAASQVREVRERLHADIASGGWRLQAFEAAVFGRASDLVIRLGAPLAALDALHLASALLCQAQSLATADKQLATAARKAGLRVFPFQ